MAMGPEPKEPTEQALKNCRTMELLRAHGAAYLLYGGSVNSDRVHTKEQAAIEAEVREFREIVEEMVLNHD